MTSRILRIRSLSILMSHDFCVAIEELDLYAGDCLVIDAVSGSGKSTVLGLISGGLAPSHLNGRVHEICGRKVTRELPRERFAGPQTIGLVLQTNMLVPYLTVIDNIRLPLTIAGIAPNMGWEAYMLDMLGLNDLLRRKPAELSVGQRQRASIARALLARPALLLLDEPVASLDPGNATHVEELIAHLSSEAGSGVILASHQAQTGVFAHVPRLTHELLTQDNVTYSLFGAAQANQFRGVG